jgi:hypothetical protein
LRLILPSDIEKMKKAVYVIFCYLLVTVQATTAQENLSNSIVDYEKQSKQNIKLYGFIGSRTLSETYLVFYEVKDGKFDLRFSEYSSSSIYQINYEGMVFVSPDMAIDFLSAYETGISCGKVLLAIDGYIIEAFIPYGKYTENGKTNKYTLEIKDDHIRKVYSKSAITDNQKVLDQLKGKATKILEKNAKLLYDEFANQFAKLESQGTYRNFRDIAMNANKETLAALATSDVNQDIAANVAIKNKEEETKRNKEKEERDAKERAENLDFMAPFGTEELSFEENYNKWSATGSPYLIYYTGIMGFFGGKGKKDVVANNELKVIGYATINEETHSVYEYKDDLLGTPSDLQLKTNNLNNMTYIYKEIDPGAKESTNTLLSSLRGYKKSFFYAYDICAGEYNHSKDLCDPAKKMPLIDYKNVAFWIKGNLIILCRKGTVPVPYAYVYAYPGAMSLDLNDKFVHKLWIYVNNKLIPKQTTEGN